MLAQVYLLGIANLPLQVSIRRILLQNACPTYSCHMYQHIHFGCFVLTLRLLNMAVYQTSFDTLIPNLGGQFPFLHVSEKQSNGSHKYSTVHCCIDDAGLLSISFLSLGLRTLQ